MCYFHVIEFWNSEENGFENSDITKAQKELMQHATH